MDNANREIQKAVVLWLGGVRLEDIRALPQVEKLINHGVLVELEPSLITGPQNQQYQALTGRSPASFGFFDTLVPACHLPRSMRGANGYTVVEEHTGRDATPALLTDILRTVGWSVQYEETPFIELGVSLQRLTQSAVTLPTCIFIKCIVETRSQLVEFTPTFVDALQAAQSWVSETGLLALFSETQPAHIDQFVNINNFLSDMGVIEQDEQTGSINWPNSLAYYAGYGQLWVNLLGRDPQGAVHPQDEYEEVRDTLVKALPNKLRDPRTDASVVERVYRKEELYTGNYLFCAPDLVVMFKPGYAPSASSTHINFDEATFSTPVGGTTVVAGTHPSSLQGFLLASAPTLASKVSESGQLIAVVPTMLHALGVEYTDLESAAISALFSPSYLETHPIHSEAHHQDLSEEDEELVINRLRDLGYI